MTAKPSTVHGSWEGGPQKNNEGPNSSDELTDTTVKPYYASTKTLELGPYDVSPSLSPQLRLLELLQPAAASNLIRSINSSQQLLLRLGGQERDDLFLPSRVFRPFLALEHIYTAMRVYSMFPAHAAS